MTLARVDAGVTRRGCISCSRGISKGQRVHENPWQSHRVSETNQKGWVMGGREGVKLPMLDSSLRLKDVGESGSNEAFHWFNSETLTLLFFPLA